jgi:hypothetical protein
MLRKLLLPAAAGLALLCASAPAAAQELRSDRATYFTFSAPVALPTTTLPAGRYLFRLADSAAMRSVVQVYSADGSKLHAMLLTLPASRDEVSDEPEVRFLEGAENAPPAIGTWWYPGMKSGWEFIYPREQAMKIAQSSKQPVLTTAQDVSNEEMKNADLVRVTPAGQTPVAGDPSATTPSGTAQRGQVAATPAPQLSTPDTPAAQTPARQPQTPAPPQPVTPAPQPVTPAATPPPQTTPAPAVPAMTPSTRSEVPQTASATPLIALAGVLALCSGLALSILRRRA